jgi:uncharacterized protein (UPF0335 family)
MAKRGTKQYDTTGQAQPSDPVALKKLVDEFIERSQNIENEIAMLNEDKKALHAEFKEKLDMKTLTIALKILKLKASISFKDSYDNMMKAIGLELVVLDENTSDEIKKEDDVEQESTDQSSGNDAEDESDEDPSDE